MLNFLQLLVLVLLGFTGICMVHAWYMHGTCMVHAWYMHGICMVYEWYMLLIVVLLGFTGALTTLFATDQSYRQLEPDSDCLQLMGPASSFGSVLKILFEGSLLGESPFVACVSESEHPVAGLALTYGLIIFSVVLLLNMVIAMMSKTFDRYYDSATQEAAAQFAGIVQDWEGET